MFLWPMVHWISKNRIVQLIWNTFYIFYSVPLFRSAPIKMIFFHVCYNQKSEEKCVVITNWSLECSCCRFPFFPHNGLCSNIGSILLEHFSSSSSDSCNFSSASEKMLMDFFFRVVWNWHEQGVGKRNERVGNVM